MRQNSGGGIINCAMTSMPMRQAHDPLCAISNIMAASLRKKLFAKLSGAGIFVSMLEPEAVKSGALRWIERSCIHPDGVNVSSRTGECHELLDLIDCLIRRENAFSPWRFQVQGASVN